MEDLIIAKISYKGFNNAKKVMKNLIYILIVKIVSFYISISFFFFAKFK